jgi:DNA-binding SARP family transcriptional activator/TolB-like protein
VIRINALGGLSVRDEAGNPIAGAAAQPRRMAILALLARAGQRGVTREKLLALLWPDADDERGPRTLAQALYALRKDLGVDDAIVGLKELRLDPATVSSDIADFSSAVSRGDDARAVALYGGPFLDGFHLPNAEEFSRWVEQERSAIATEHARAIESLARGAQTAGDVNRAVEWWRKLAALDPLNARIAIGLMDALAASGERTAAIQHARVYELLVEQELDLPPDAEVIALAERLRQAAAEPSTKIAPPVMAQPDVSTASPMPAESIAMQPASEVALATRRPWSRLAAGAGILVALGALSFIVVRGRSAVPANAMSPGGRVVAIGNIAAFNADSAPSGLTAPVADLLTTNLARIHTLHVVSRGRMLELMRASGGGNASDTGAGSIINAARQAGATEIIDGTLYTRPGGRLRLDLRRVDLATGAVGDAYTVEGSDLFALVDSGTVRLVAALGGTAPAGSVADVTTHSLAAYRIYEQGVRAYYRGDTRTALQLFDSALAEDSLFAMAALYDAWSDPNQVSHAVRMERAKRLAVRASDRERLMILAGWAFEVSSPSLSAYADTLLRRYPTDVEGYLYSGISRAFDCEFLDALAPLQRVVAMDSAGLHETRPHCAACDALPWLSGSYAAIDSLSAAEREARRWLRLQPVSENAALTLVTVLEREGKVAEAESVFRATSSPNRPEVSTWEIPAIHRIRVGDYAGADSILLARVRDPNPVAQVDALWDLTISLREQGRLTEALDVARRTREPTARVFAGATSGPAPINVLEAQVLLEMGQSRAAFVLFDSLARQRGPNEVSSQRARAMTWMLAQAAGAQFMAGDTAPLTRLADSIQKLGEQSGYGRDRRLHHYVRGLVYASRRDDRRAIDEFKSAIYSLPAGFTRTNYELARVYLRDGRPRDAVAVLQPVFRGALDGSNLYVTRTEIHELLAKAWDAAGSRDSAAAHYQWAANAWRGADPSLAPRLQAVRRRLSEIGGR